MDFLRILIKKFRELDKRKKAYLIVAVSIILIMLWAFVSAGLITGNFNRAVLKNSKDEQKVDAIGIIITETKDGKKYFEIYGETGNYSNDHSIATLHNVVGNFYKDGNVSMSFQSSKGTYDEKAGVITLYENTYIVLEDKTSLESDRLTWSGSDKETVAEGNVKIKKSDEMYALADKCIISAGYDKFKIIGKTKTQIYGKQGK
ncbi:MAG: LPS export ABC transporter periplasmic protein LptC [Cyanobacteria bacterium SIG31]|nr:LPS export ABC transporter periplasmic protein LptC [Cyanobacteria bacterium SIG31]